jgi:hypothetical protein
MRIGIDNSHGHSPLTRKMMLNYLICLRAF